MAGKDVQPENETRHAIASHDKVVRGTETSFEIEPRECESPGDCSPDIFIDDRSRPT
jgi:hypothetical protein